MAKVLYSIPFLSIFVLLFFLSFSSCSSSESQIEDGQSSETVESMDLTERLYRLNEVRVEGYGEDAVVQVRGGRADEIPRYMSPIFMVNGQVLNYSYQIIYQMLNEKTITNIRVLKNAQAATYNTGSGQSVIAIITKKGF